MTKLSLEQLIGSLMTHEIVIDSKTKEPKIKGIALRTELQSEGSDNDGDVDHVTRRFNKFLKKNKNNNHKKGGNFKGKSTTSNFKKSATYSGCFKCGYYNHRINKCPLWDDEKHKKKEQTKKVFKKAVIAVVWEDSDSEEEHSEAQCHETKFCLNAVQIT